jgi:hypothetical protein
MGVKRFLISGGQMESPVAGAPAQAIRSAYAKASEEHARRQVHLAVVLVNDIDTGLEQRREILPQAADCSASIQLDGVRRVDDLVDYPNSVEGETLRIPIIITETTSPGCTSHWYRSRAHDSLQWIPPGTAG